MNIGEAVEVISYAIELEDAGAIQPRLQEVLNSISGMANNPQDPAQQTALAANIDALRSVLNNAHARISPAESERLNILGARNFFETSLVDEIVESVNSNPATPAVARDFIQGIFNERSRVLEDFRATQGLSKRLGWAEEVNHQKSAEVGFTIPRAIFDNRFDNFIKELEFVKRFVSSIYETLNEDSADIEVSSLSTTDPLILLAVAVIAAKQVGSTISWALDSWKKVEEIRDLRSRAAKMSSFSDDEVQNVFDGKIKEQIKAEVAEESARLVSNMAASPRKNELEAAFNIYLPQLLARIERGMTVEIRLLGGPADSEDISPQDEAEFVAISDKLHFPKPSDRPVLALNDGAVAPDDGAPKKKPGASGAA